MLRSSGVSSLMSWRAAALGNSSSSAVRSSGDISLRIPTTCSCAIPRRRVCCASTSRYSKTSAARLWGRTRKTTTCSSSEKSVMTSAISAGGHSEKSSRNEEKFRASIRLRISGWRIFPTMMVPGEPRERAPPSFVTFGPDKRNRSERHASACPGRAEARPSGLGICEKLANMSRMTPTATGQMIRREIGDDGICVLTFDRPESGANIFDAPTMESLREHVDAIEKDSSIKGVIVTSAKKSIFIAGADLKTLLKQAQTGELRSFIAEGQKVFNRLAALQVPTVAAIHGACAGGGYEITLACDHRVASNDPATKIGLPETTLGLVPAWGGATRLPRLLGPDIAAEVILNGKLYGSKEALELGLVDQVVSKEEMLEAARQKLAGGKRKPSPKQSGMTAAAPKASGNVAPGRAYEIIKGSGDSSIEESLAMEVDAISELGATDATQNLIRNFFLADKYRKGSSKTAPEKITHAAVIGAGIMGSGIAQWLSSRGVSVILRDVDSAAIDRGLANIEKTYADGVKRGLMSEEKAKEGRARIVASMVPGTVRDVQIVIEAASEKLEIKKKIFADLAANTSETAILATNTSALPIAELATSTGSPARVVGLHFFNPVSRMKLIEVVVGKQTSDEIRERALGFARQIGKLPVLVHDSPGFLVNRVLFPYLLDAAEMFQSGVSAEEIDRALLAWGMPMGQIGRASCRERV